MTLEEALDAVLADLHDHRITGDAVGLFNVMRHIDLLCRITSRVTGETQYCLFYDHADAADQARAEPLSQAAGHLGRATAHYAQALALVVTLCKSSAHTTLQKRLDAIDVHRHLGAHRADAFRALSDARRYLTEPRPAGGDTAPTPPPAQQPRASPDRQPARP
ncbi:hypothetical protein RFN58_34225 [Streptomyces iakyrus]|uniref:hypothetical protein n=1 Tax=Streptomyces iakyrus TaxID=68219 RepID=UPI00068CC647|nr:hypothetical protein [Streptomyces iakyrus]